MTEEQSIDESAEEFIELLELDADEDQDPAVIRKSFRIPIRDNETFEFIIHNTSFPIEDINSEGAGIKMVKDLSFTKGMTLSGCELILAKERFSNLECEIAHITASKGTSPIFGVKWLGMAGDSDWESEKRRLETVCTALKKKLLDATENGNGSDS